MSLLPMSLIDDVNVAYQKVLDNVPEAREPVYGDWVMEHRQALAAALKNFRERTGLPLATVVEVDVNTPVEGEPENPASKKGFRSAHHRHADFLQLSNQAIAHLSG